MDLSNKTKINFYIADIDKNLNLTVVYPPDEVEDSVTLELPYSQGTLITKEEVLNIVGNANTGMGGGLTEQQVTNIATNIFNRLYIPKTDDDIRTLVNETIVNTDKTVSDKIKEIINNVLTEKNISSTQPGVSEEKVTEVVNNVITNNTQIINKLTTKITQEINNTIEQLNNNLDLKANKAEVDSTYVKKTELQAQFDTKVDKTVYEQDKNTFLTKAQANLDLSTKQETQEVRTYIDSLYNTLTQTDNGLTSSLSEFKRTTAQTLTGKVDRQELDNYATKQEDLPKLATKVEVESTYVKKTDLEADKLLLATKDEVNDKADASEVYSRDESDNLFVKKSEKIDAYNKQESDNKYATQDTVNLKADTAQVYTKDVADVTFVKVTDKIDAYSKNETDDKYALKTDLDTKADTDYSYSKQDADDRFVNKTDNTKAIEDATNQIRTSLSSDYVKKSEFNSVTGDLNLSEYTTTAQLEATYAKKIELLGLQNETQVNTLIDNKIANKVNADTVYPKGEVDSKFLTKEDANNQFETKVKVTELEQALNDKVDSNALAGYARQTDIANLAATSYVDSKVQEEVTKLTAQLGDKLNTDVYTTDKPTFALKTEIPSLTDYARTSEVESKIDEAKLELNNSIRGNVKEDTLQATLDGYLTKTQATADYLSKSDATTLYLSKTDADSTYVKHATVDSKIEAGINKLESKFNSKLDTDTYTTDKDTFLTKDDATNAYVNKQDAESTYVKKTELTTSIDTNTFATKTDLIDKADTANVYSKQDADDKFETTDHATNTYVTKTDIQQQFTEYTKTVDLDDIITAKIPKVQNVDLSTVVPLTDFTKDNIANILDDKLISESTIDQKIETATNDKVLKTNYEQDKLTFALKSELPTAGLSEDQVNTKIEDKLKTVKLDLESKINGKLSRADIQSDLNDKATKDELNNKADVGASYTKDEADSRFVKTTDKVDAYNKQESDGKYALKTDLDTKANTDSVYTKLVADTTFVKVTDKIDAYTKNETDDKYATKDEVNSKANASEVYSITNADNTFVKKSDLTTEITDNIDNIKAELGNEYIKRKELSTITGELDLSAYSTTELNDKKYATKTEIANFKTEDQVNTLIDAKLTNKAGTDYAYSKGESDNKYETSQHATDTYETKTKVAQLEQTLNDKADKTELSNYITTVTLNGYATSSYVDEKEKQIRQDLEGRINGKLDSQTYTTDKATFALKTEIANMATTQNVEDAKSLLQASINTKANDSEVVKIVDLNNRVETKVNELLAPVNQTLTEKVNTSDYTKDNIISKLGDTYLKPNEADTRFVIASDYNKQGIINKLDGHYLTQDQGDTRYLLASSGAATESLLNQKVQEAKTELTAEIGKKVAIGDYTTDKATFALKSDLNNYTTTDNLNQNFALKSEYLPLTRFTKDELTNLIEDYYVKPSDIEATINSKTSTIDGKVEGKVNATDYEQDKATFALKTDLDNYTNTKKLAKTYLTIQEADTTFIKKAELSAEIHNFDIDIMLEASEAFENKANVDDVYVKSQVDRDFLKKDGLDAALTKSTALNDYVKKAELSTDIGDTYLTPDKGDERYYQKSETLNTAGVEAKVSELENKLNPLIEARVAQTDYDTDKETFLTKESAKQLYVTQATLNDEISKFDIDLLLDTSDSFDLKANVSDVYSRDEADRAFVKPDTLTKYQTIVVEEATNQDLNNIAALKATGYSVIEKSCNLQSLNVTGVTTTTIAIVRTEVVASTVDEGYIIQTTNWVDEGTQSIKSAKRYALTTDSDFKAWVVS